MPCSLSILDSLDEGAMVQEDILDASYIKTKATGFSRDAKTYEFNVGSAGDYFDKNRSKLIVKFRITRPGGSNLQPGDYVTFSNYPIASLFLQQCYDLLRIKDQIIESWVQTGFWYRDTTGQMDNANHTPADVQNVIQPYNVGLRNRSMRTKL